MACLLLLLVLLSAVSQGCLAGQTSQDLTKKLSKATGVGVMPVDGGVDVKVGAALIRIVDFDEKNGVATVTVWERMLWQDERLTWEPSSYDGITAMRLSPKAIWTPDITCYTDLDAEMSRPDYNIVLHSHGEVLHIPKATRRVGCNLLDDGETWRCTLKYGSWSFDGNLVDVDNYEGIDHLDLTDYARHPTYQLAEGEWNVGAKVIYYPCCTEPYPTSILPFFIKRRSEEGNEEEDDVITNVMNSMQT